MIRASTALCIALLVVGCTAATPSVKAMRSTEPSAVVGPVWQWTAMEAPAGKLAVNVPERYTIQLGADGNAKALFDCNRGGGSYQISTGTLSFGPLLSTRMACPPDTLDAPFMQGLSETSTFSVANNQLTLGLKSGGTMTFQAAP